MSKRRDTVAFLAIGVLVLLALGGALLFAADQAAPGTFVRDVLRDLAIACWVSAFLTGAYEMYARTRFDLGKIEALLDTVYGSGVPLEVWRSIKSSLLSRARTRRNAQIHLRIIKDEPVEDGCLVIEIDVSYDLFSLEEKETDVTVSHRLDEHIVSKNGNLPRFLEASIGPRSASMPEPGDWTSADKAIRVRNGRVYLDGRLSAASEGKGLPVRVRRREVRTFPGSYYLVTTEFAEGARIYLDEALSNVNVYVTVRPKSEDFPLSKVHILIVEEPLLPGHSVEFKFTNKELTPADGEVRG